MQRFAPLGLNHLARNKDKSYIASQQKLVYTLTTECMLIIDATLSTQFFNFMTNIYYWGFLKCFKDIDIMQISQNTSCTILVDAWLVQRIKSPAQSPSHSPQLVTTLKGVPVSELPMGSAEALWRLHHNPAFLSAQSCFCHFHFSC